MPYEVTFTKRADAQAVAARILPALRQRFGDQLEADQEERSGSIRFDDGPVSLAVDIFCDDQQTGRYRIHLTSKTKRFAFLKRVEDVPQLEELKRIVAGEIAEWTGKCRTSRRCDANALVCCAAMRAAIIAVGSEMLGPSRLDTNSLKATAALEDFGIAVVRKSVIGDHLDDLAAEIEFSLSRADLLVTSGGLGPTEDDLTRDALVKALGLKTATDQSIIDRLEVRFRARGWAMPEVNKRQATVFPPHQTLTNDRGTAPGFHLHVRDKHVWVFPGVPGELEWMVATYLVPWLDQQFGGRTRQRRVLKIAGLGESAVEEKLAPYYAAHRDELLTILASPGAVELHLHGEGDPDAVRAEIAKREKELRDIFGPRMFGADDDTLESVIGELLASRGETLSTAESCTGGLFSSRITDISGSSRYFMGGAICYTGDAKVAMVDVDPGLIQANGEVSEPVAIAMAQGVRRRFNTTYGVGITGIAGPTGGSEAKPVGTVHIAVAGAQRHEHRKLFWPGTRAHVKWFSTQSALDLLRRFVMERPTS